MTDDTDIAALVDKHRAGIKEITGPCACIDAFKTRGLIDPACMFHECSTDIAALLDRIEALTAERDAARANALEEAATIAESWRIRNGNPNGAWSIAADIRALGADR